MKVSIVADDRDKSNGNLLAPKLRGDGIAARNRASTKTTGLCSPCEINRAHQDCDTYLPLTVELETPSPVFLAA
jgi:hypothetical protein